MSKFALRYLKKSSAYLIDICVLFDQIGDAEFKNGVKTGTGSSFRRHFGEKPNFWVSRPRISVIRLCSATTRPADGSVDRRRFEPPSWTGNRTATPRRTDSDHAERFKNWCVTDVCIAFADTDSGWQLAQPDITLGGGKILYIELSYVLVLLLVGISMKGSTQLHVVQRTFLSFNYYLAEQ